MGEKAVHTTVTQDDRVSDFEIADDLSIEDLCNSLNAIENPEALWDHIFAFKDLYNFDIFFYRHKTAVGALSKVANRHGLRGIAEITKELDGKLNNWRAYENPVPWPSNSRPQLFSQWMDYFIANDPKDAHLYESSKQYFPSGYLFPVYGPLQRQGYCVFNLQETPDEHTLQQLHILSQAIHLRFCEIVDAMRQKAFDLSGREKEILYWVARGKSNSVIADIMGISPHTVNGYLRKIYLKTDTSDRTTAALRAISEGLLD